MTAWQKSSIKTSWNAAVESNLAQLKLAFPVGFFKEESLGCCNHSTAQLPVASTACKTKEAKRELSAKLDRKLNNKMRHLLCCNLAEMHISTCAQCMLLYLHGLLLPCVILHHWTSQVPAPLCCFYTWGLIMWNSWKQEAGSQEVNEKLQ